MANVFWPAGVSRSSRNLNRLTTARHLPKAVALLQDCEDVRLSTPGFHHNDFPRFKDEHRIGLVMFAEKQLVRRDTHDRAQAEQELEDVGPDSTKNASMQSSFSRPRRIFFSSPARKRTPCGMTTAIFPVASLSATLCSIDNSLEGTAPG